MNARRRSALHHLAVDYIEQLEAEVELLSGVMLLASCAAFDGSTSPHLTLLPPHTSRYALLF